MTDSQFNYLNFLIVSDNGKSIEIKDQNGNSISLNANGVTINSSKDISIVTNGKININANHDLTLTGLNISATANIGFTGKGNATAEVSSAGQTTVKGGLVMIN